MPVSGTLLAAIAAALLQALGFTIMALAARQGGISPNRFSWLIWSIVASLAALSSWHAGATGPLGGALMNAAGCIVMLLLSLRSGVVAVAGLDLACLVIALFGLLAWAGTDDPVLGLILFLGADACGALPTIRNALLDPAREHAGGWTILALAGIAAVLSVEPAEWALSWAGFGHWGGAVYVALVNLAIAACILGTGLRRGRQPAVNKAVG
ncbi:MAG: hypothetical protein U1E17_00535 [Geminicoccaceae bacterium]